MAVIDVELDELRKLVGRDLDEEELVEELFGLGVEHEYTEDGEMGLEVVPDRPDRLSVEGIARSLRLDMGIESGIYIPDTQASDYKITVEGSVDGVRPYITGAVVKNVDLGGGGLESLIQIQEKLHDTLGRRRNKGAIGIHDLITIKGRDITYRGIEPESDSFVPLEIGDEELLEMTPKEVMDNHEVGSRYAHILEGERYAPAIYDDIGLFSFPPIINSKRTEVTEDSRDVFIEMTGIDQWTIDKMLNILLYVLDSRGGEIYEVEVEYPDSKQLKPDLSVKTKQVSHTEIESIIGVDLDTDEVEELAERSGLKAHIDGDQEMGDTLYTVEIPPYRTDVLHPRDVIDDIGRAYGFNELEPRYPDVATIGELTSSTKLENAVRRQLVGLGFQDLLNFVMTDPENNFDKMKMDRDPDRIDIENPYSEEYSMMRTWLLPSLLEVLGNNTHREYPQNIAEIGLTAVQDSSTETGVREDMKVAAVMAGTESGYEEMKSRLTSLVSDFGGVLETPRLDHPSFIDGRVADVVIDGDSYGVIGEFAPEVLSEWNVVQPVSGFEFRLEGLRIESQ